MILLRASIVENQKEAAVKKMKMVAVVNEEIVAMEDKKVEVAVVDKVAGTALHTTTVVSLEILADITLVQLVANIKREMS